MVEELREAMESATAAQPAADEDVCMYVQDETSTRTEAQTTRRVSCVVERAWRRVQSGRALRAAQWKRVQL